MQLTYWVTNENDIATFNGQLLVKSKTEKVDGKSSKKDLRVCLEITTEGQENKYREQMMFNAGVTSRAKVTWA